MSARHDKAEIAEKAFVKDLKARKWKKHEIDAALGGWEYVLDNTCTDDPDRYHLEKMDGDGSDAAMDMADSVIDFGDGKWKKRDKGYVADLIYEGMSAARKFIREMQ